PPRREALAGVPSARGYRPGATEYPPGSDPRRAHQRPGPPPDHRDADADPIAGRCPHDPRQLAHPGGDGEDRRPSGHPPRWAAAGSPRARRADRPKRRRGVDRSGDAVPPADGAGEPDASLRGCRMSRFGTLVAKEMAALFTSPIAYTLVAVFLLLLGY